MSEQSSQDEESLKPLAIEGKLPLKAVGIENLKEANPKHMPPHRYIHPWFARRPTPAARLAVLASVLPAQVGSDDILKHMQIGPKELNDNIAGYVENKKASEDDRDGTLGEHYGYERPFTQTPEDQELEELHALLRDTWGGDLPTVFDPTAGGGVIPFESIRYNIPTKANELNPIPGLILKVLLEYAPEVGTLESDLRHWRNKIEETASEALAQYYPTAEPNRVQVASACTYKINCESCGGNLPLVPKWWLHKKTSSKGVAIKPHFDNGEVSYEAVTLPDDVTKSEFNPSEGIVTRGDATCPHCGVVTEGNEIKQKLRDDQFDYEVYGVKYETANSGSGFRGGLELDQRAITEAAEAIESDFKLAEFLSVSIPDGYNTDQPKPYGITEWRDLFNPRQLLAHYEYFKAFESHTEVIQEEHDKDTAEAIFTILSLTSSKMVDRNSRLSPWDTSKGYPSQIFKDNNLAPKRMFVDNNLFAESMGFRSQSDKIIDCYEEIVTYVHSRKSADLNIGDAANLPAEWRDNSIQAAVIDPPYYDSIMYGELSDVFYVIQKEYLENIHPDLFHNKLTNKSEEAVANPSKFDGIAGESQSKSELAKKDYEEKMSDIFQEVYRIIEPGGVLTVMFTHKETDAWDTLTMSLINAGFTITATHPITSEIPQRDRALQSSSADSTILLSGRKSENPTKPEYPSLWTDVRADTRRAAKEAARDLLDSGLSLTKTDVIIAAFGPTLRVFADSYPVVDDEDNEISPRKALEEAREAVTQVLVNEYLEIGGIDDLDDVTEWYVLCWLVHERQTFSYDEGRQLGLGIGVDIDDIKRDTKTWRKSRGDISLRGHDGRVQNVDEKPENRSSRTPVNPDDLSFGLALDKVHAAMHVYDVKGESACCDWLRERNFDSDSTFKATLKALLQVLPHDHEDWDLARDLAAGRTRDVLDLDFSPNVFAEDSEGTSQRNLSDY
jgi:adenine-specific DNA methylase